MNNIIILIIGMGIVTFLPRLIPLMFISKMELSYNRRKFLEFIPYTSLTILIVRGVLTSSSEMILPTLIGLSVSGLIGYFKSNLVLSVGLGIIAAFIAINVL